jgi:hypothetical protein
MYKIQNNLHGYFIDHETYGAIFLPDEMVEFIESYLSDMSGLDGFIQNYNETVKE